MLGLVGPVLVARDDVDNWKDHPTMSRKIGKYCGRTAGGGWWAGIKKLYKQGDGAQDGFHWDSSRVSEMREKR